jgi:hypothetical protein
MHHMPEYRAYLVGSDDHIQNAVHLNCADDDQAIILAKEFADTATTSNCGSLIGKWRRFLRCLTIPRQHQIVNEQLAKRQLGLQGRAF